MIPQIIHYCWFGNNAKTQLAKRCIRSWRKFFPEYQIVEWNEKNYDIQSAPLYVRQAYEAKKWAFVSDYVRFDILYRVGGIYFDTDVEVVKSMDDILDLCGYAGCEIDGGDDSLIRVNPGNGMAFEPANIICKDVLDTFINDTFITNNGEFNYKTIVDRTTDVLLNRGLKNAGGQQVVEGVRVFPKEFFAPIDCSTGIMKRTPQTRSIHWWDASWQNKKNGKRIIISRYYRTRVRKMFGNNYSQIRKIHGK